MPRQALPNFSHGDRVRIGFNGPRGVVLRCKRKPPATGHYFKVKLDDGRWVWPDGAVADSEGQYEKVCAQCGIPYRTHDLTDPLCNNCDAGGVRREEAPEHVRDRDAYAGEVRRRREADARRRAPEDPDAAERF